MRHDRMLLILLLLVGLLFLPSCAWFCEEFPNLCPSPISKSILIYILSDRDDSWQDGFQWYSGPDQVKPIVDVLASLGYTTTVHDKVTLPTLRLDEMRRYLQVWILEGDADSQLEVTSQEADDLYRFFETGGKIWISFENINWVEDAEVFSQRFGVYYGGAIYSSRSPQPVSSTHPLFNGVSWIEFDKEVGYLQLSNPAVEVLWWYAASDPAGSYPGIAVLDERAQGRGRAIFDSGWVLGYAYWGSKSYDDRPHDNLKFVKNVAHWLEGR